LEENTRYDRYKPEEIYNREWVKLLGADVNNLEHMSLTYGLTRQFIKYNENPPATWDGPGPEDARFNQQEKEDLLLTATVHDWGEAVVGDKMYDLKKDSDEEEELEVMQKITQGLYGEEESAELAGRIKTVLTDVLPNRKSKLGKAFNAIERVGYLRTGLRAWDVSNSLDQDKQELKTGLQWLTNNVLLNQISTLVDYAQSYPAVDAYLKQNADRISSAFDNLPESVFDKYDAHEVAGNKAKFESAKAKWQEAINPQPIAA
jgi:hypothetical protein